MDYTRSPSDNKKPGPENFAFLEAMYGTVNDGRNRNRQRAFLRRLWAPTVAQVPADLAQQMREEVLKIEQRADGKEHLDGWLEEHRSDFGSVHSRSFGQGYSVKVAKLLVTPDET